jgi:HSP20 family protein
MRLRDSPSLSSGEPIMTCSEVEKATPASERNGTTFFKVRPRVDILETNQEFLLLADMPGVSPNEIELSFEKGELTLSGARGAANYERTFSVSDVVAADQIAAEMKNGVLTVRLPKSEGMQPRKIAVQG